MKKIVLTGGGTAGHVTPNIALLPSLKEAGYEVFYIGSYTGIEKTLIEDLGIPYYGISSGKLRRYRSLKNLSDPFRVLHGLFQAKRLMKKIKPDIVFSKGGFVSVPVVLAAGSRHIPVIIHESDMTPGLANKIAMRKATKYAAISQRHSSTFLKEKLFLQVLLSDRSFCLATKLPDLTFATSQLTNLLFLLSAEVLALSM